jgi:hypothetical protein
MRRRVTGTDDATGVGHYGDDGMTPVALEEARAVNCSGNWLEKTRMRLTRT